MLPGMDSLLGLLVHVVILFAVAGLLYWAATEIAKLLPAPFGNVLRVVVLVILVLSVAYFLLGEFGLEAGYGHRHHW
jgi:hypothetical protein